MKKNWSQIKKHIGGFSRVQLVGLVQDLYQANPRNQEFLHTRFPDVDQGTSLAPYKKRIKEALIPRSWDWDVPINYREARKAISDYNKARGELEQTIELMLFYVKCGNDLTLTYGDIDERFYDSMGSMFGSLARKLQANPDLLSSWFSKLEAEAKRVGETGWGYGDELHDWITELRDDLPDA